MLMTHADTLGQLQADFQTLKAEKMEQGEEERKDEKERELAKKIAEKLQNKMVQSKVCRH